MINLIPKFRSSDGRKINLSNEFLKKKLLESLTNENIINLSRGEGRPRVLNNILIQPEVLFNWGEKSMHAYLEGQNSKLREFCDPNCIDKKLLLYYVNKYSNQLNFYSKRFSYLKNENISNKFQNLIDDILEENDRENLLLIKEWLIYAFHTAGVKEFAKISSCISCSYGEKRFQHGNRFGQGRGENAYYVILDLWVDKNEEGITFRKTQFVNQQLSRYGVNWFYNYHDEIMLKYAIFPQQLIGYYTMDRGRIIEYVVSKHYVEEWENNEEFSIGDYIYIEQNIDFNQLGPYRTVYEYEYGKGVSIAARQREERTSKFDRTFK